MDNAERNAIARLERELIDMRRALLAVPSRFANGPLPFRRIIIDKGNTLGSGEDGIKYVATVASVPSAYDPTVTDTFIPGIGRGTLWEGGENLGLVLVANTSAGTIQGAALVQGEPVAVDEPIAIPVGGGPDVVYAYPPAWL